MQVSTWTAITSRAGIARPRRARTSISRFSLSFTASSPVCCYPMNHERQSQTPARRNKQSPSLTVHTQAVPTPPSTRPSSAASSCPRSIARQCQCRASSLSPRARRTTRPSTRARPSSSSAPSPTTAASSRCRSSPSPRFASPPRHVPALPPLAASA